MLWIIVSSFSFCCALFESDKLISHPIVISAADSVLWKTLPHKCIEKGLYNTAAALCHRLLMLSGDPDLTTAAIQGLIKLVDKGFPEEVVSWIAKSDVTDLRIPEEESALVGSLHDQFYLYRWIYFTYQSSPHWAAFYQNALKFKVFPKLLFYQALSLFGKKQWEETEVKLKELLKQCTSDMDVFFVKKIVRTLARTFFEQKKYTEAYDIYSHFLLKTQFQQPTDWLEAAWCLFYQKQYPEALGMLYNLYAGSSLAPKSILQPEILEVFVLKSLIYQKTCFQEGIEQLDAAFKKKFGSVLDAIKKGESLNKFSELKNIYSVHYERTRHFLVVSEKLKEEMLQLKNKKDFFKKNEIKMLQNVIDAELFYLKEAGGFLKEKNLQDAAEQLALMQENLRFMQFDVQRERFDPDQVFKESLKDIAISTEPPVVIPVRIWSQTGSFWLQERLNYQARLQNQCR